LLQKTRTWLVALDISFVVKISILLMNRSNNYKK